jgi:D-glycero-D-manno-heptose 1,7-bisphosphate phosphatase
MIKAVFVDRDGTINVEKGYVYKYEDFDLLPGVIEGLKLLTLYGIKIFIITNQAGIAKGYYTEVEFNNITEIIQNNLENKGIKIERTLYCPHHPEGIIPAYTKTCLCRKPGTLLLESIIEENSYKKNEVALIGDKNSDIDAGKKLGLTTYLVLTGYGLEHQENTKATYIKPDLLGAVRHLLNVDKRNASEISADLKDEACLSIGKVNNK